MSLKVLHVYRTYYPDSTGGLEEAIRQIALTTSRYGVENRIFTLSPNPEPVELSFSEAKVIRARSWGAPASCNLGGYDSFKKFAAQVQWADVVHYLFPWPFADILHFWVRPKKPCVMTYISDVVNKGKLGLLYQPLIKKMAMSMDVLVANSSAYAQTSPILSTLNLKQPIRIIPLGIAEESYGDFFRDAGTVSIFDRFGLTKDKYLLFLGVLRPYKGLDTLVEAAIKSKVQIAIAGTGPELKHIQGLVSSHNNIHLLGHVSNPEKIALIQSCRGLVLPSHMRSEAFGMVLVEAAMCEKPLISCEIGTGTSFINLHEETGFVVPPADSDALAFAMNQLSSKRGVALQLGKSARRRYEQLFSGPALGKGYSDLFSYVMQASFE